MAKVTFLIIPLYLDFQWKRSGEGKLESEKVSLSSMPQEAQKVKTGVALELTRTWSCTWRWTLPKQSISLDI